MICVAYDVNFVGILDCDIPDCVFGICFEIDTWGIFGGDYLLNKNFAE
jgi:hypothetical protein